MFFRPAGSARFLSGALLKSTANESRGPKTAHWEVRHLQPGRSPYPTRGGSFVESRVPISREQSKLGDGEAAAAPLARCLVADRRLRGAVSRSMAEKRLRLICGEADKCPGQRAPFGRRNPNAHPGIDG
jgi:hypothetical protein